MRPLRELFERGQADGDVREDIPSAWLTESLVGLIVGMFDVGPLPGPGGHDRHDHRPLPRRSPRPRSAPRMNDNDIADPIERTTSWNRTTATASCSTSWSRYLREHRTELREQWARRITRRASSCRS